MNYIEIKITIFCIFVLLLLYTKPSIIFSYGKWILFYNFRGIRKYKILNK